MSHRTQLELTNVSYRIGNVILLSDIGLSLTETGITAIMGFNGAGKSVLLKIMHGILEPDIGSVLWNKKPSDETHLRSQAMVFQKPMLLRRSTKANIDFVLSQRGAKNAVFRDSLLERVGLLSKARLPARALSGGEQQRLALARALACKPSILFLDEATASLDPASTAIIERIVREQSQAGTKVIMVTHSADQAKRLSDQVVFLHAGAVTEQTGSQKFFDQPSSEAAKAYLNGQLYLTE